eukprot:g48413.t1
MVFPTRPIVNTDNGEFYPSVEAASKATGIPFASLSGAVLTGRGQAGGCTWCLHSMAHLTWPAPDSDSTAL